MTREPRKPLLRSLGEFVGEIWKGVKADPTRTVTKRRVEEREASTTSGKKVILRRTTIEEVIVPDARRQDAAGADPHADRGDAGRPG
ncbi:MAG: hypothetical protein SFY69_09010 [Planctomycetota bacterium]|nr:hypothetical protein [Planctomycetota bacterium]